MAHRQRIIEAAARIYASSGFRGTTTRRIAEEAGVNEVTLFRLFGSKAALIAEAMRHQEFIDPHVGPPDPSLTPLAQLTKSNAAVMQNLAKHRHLIRQGMAEQEEHPELCNELCGEKRLAFERFVVYARDLARREGGDPNADVRTAASMLFSAIFHDVMGRDMVPETFPPLNQAASRYAKVFLRSIGVPAAGKRAAVRRKRRRNPKLSAA
ncbi:MAG TPA: helix-turn-helix domain-containing protein [Gemmatimonadaceae bacterium]|nr:helix-turn-helix domain-containing protein [Gemmatimonadaceae bacterium]